VAAVAVAAAIALMLVLAVPEAAFAQDGGGELNVKGGVTTFAEWIGWIILLVTGIALVSAAYQKRVADAAQGLVVGGILGAVCLNLEVMLAIGRALLNAIGLNGG
jgi:hypothetical protein